MDKSIHKRWDRKPASRGQVTGKDQSSRHRLSITLVARISCPGTLGFYITEKFSTPQCQSSLGHLVTPI